MALPEFEDLKKYPRQVILYLCLIGAGWLVNRVVPDEKDNENTYLKQKIEDCEKNSKTMTYEYIDALKEKNNIIKSKDSALKTVDSSLNSIYKKVIKQTKR